MHVFLEKGKKTLKRIDRGCTGSTDKCAVQKCSAMYDGGKGGPQWTSEIWCVYNESAAYNHA